MTTYMNFGIVYSHFVMDIEDHVAQFISKVVFVLVRTAYSKGLLGKAFSSGEMNEIISEKIMKLGFGVPAFFVVFIIREI